jgi:hypothetical protein
MAAPLTAPDDHAAQDLNLACRQCGGTIDAIRCASGWIIGVADQCPQAAMDRCANLALSLLTAVGEPDSKRTPPQSDQDQLRAVLAVLRRDD